LTSLTVLPFGLASRYGVAAQWRVIGVVYLVSLIANAYALGLPQQSFWRIALYQAPFFLLHITYISIVLRSQKRDFMDMVLLVIFVASAASFFAKPFLVLMFDTGPTPQAYLSSQYALYSQTLGTILNVAAGLIMIVILMRDMLTEVTEQSRTDQLSGLLNRRGFEDHAERALASRNTLSAVFSLVICDLDYFKRINDTYGHDAGDRVIQVFGDILRHLGSKDAIIGRVGGEEFAIFLRGSNLNAARALSERIRTTLTQSSLSGLPPDMRFTASFGVAEIAVGESLADTLRRADAALYAAKRNGRDQVQLDLFKGPKTAGTIG
jgi:diguanylate cyclase (GGDEF)-like protein